MWFTNTFIFVFTAIDPRLTKTKLSGINQFRGGNFFFFCNSLCKVWLVKMFQKNLSCLFHNWYTSSKTCSSRHIFREEKHRHPHWKLRARWVSGISKLSVPFKRLPAVEVSGRPATPNPARLWWLDPGGRLSARLHQNLRLARPHRETRYDRVRRTISS